MQIAEAPVRDVRPLFAGERADLLALLTSLGDADWAAPTEAGHWTVKDVALHLLDNDLVRGWPTAGSSRRYSPRSPAGCRSSC